jgi:hypothetical protein
MRWSAAIHQNLFTIGFPLPGNIIGIGYGSMKDKTTLSKQQRIASRSAIAVISFTTVAPSYLPRIRIEHIEKWLEIIVTLGTACGLIYGLVRWLSKICAMRLSSEEKELLIACSKGGEILRYGKAPREFLQIDDNIFSKEDDLAYGARYILALNQLNHKGYISCNGGGNVYTLSSSGALACKAITRKTTNKGSSGIFW